MNKHRSTNINGEGNDRPLARNADFRFDSGTGESHFNSLALCWQRLAPDAVFTIAETGFGCGVDFLGAWQRWLMCAPATATLHFVATEESPLSRYELQQTLLQQPEVAPLSQQLFDQYPPVDARGFHRLRFGNVHLTLIFAEATAGLEQLLPISTPGDRVASSDCGWGPFTSTSGIVDAWLLADVMTKNLQVWHEDVFEVVARLSRPGATLTALTGADEVRRSLRRVGFAVGEIPAPDNHQEILHGHFSVVQNGAAPSGYAAATSVNATIAQRIQVRPPRRKPSASWHLCSRSLPPTRHVTVIGAGLAGCHTAYALAQKGFAVTLVDRGNIASGASGNPLGVVYSKLSSSPGTLADFNMAALTYALRFYNGHDLFKRCGNRCGVLQIPEDAEEVEQQRAIAASFSHSPELVQWLDRDAASTVAGIRLATSGLWLPNAGSFDPPLLCRTLASHTGIRVLDHRDVHKLNYSDGQWHLLDEHDSQIHQSPAVVIACAESARRFDQCLRLPSKAIRGQISLAAATSESQHLQTIMCGDGYIAPAHDGRHCLGASFNLTLQTTHNRWEEHHSNLGQIRRLAPALAELNVAELSDGRVSMRCTTPDYLPIIGPVATENTMIERFARFRKNAKAIVDAPGEYWPGLFINIGHGSKGLTYTPLCAELLACMITNEPLPVSRNIALHLHAARFLVRDLARRRL